MRLPAKIGIAVVCLVAIAGLYKWTTIVKNKQVVRQSNQKIVHTQVEGASTQKENTAIEGSNTQINVQETVQEKIKTLVEQAQEISLPEVASSSPQMQKLVNDLKNLQDYPKSQAKETCQKICANF